ncbi:MAG: histidinol dehydrogenase [Candidatus Melainabacteria bacterium]|nr:MAG: histidinol dehydrogenase [Candidatus Melainabacteria bacterium]
MIQIHELKSMSKADLDKLMVRANVDINEVKASVEKIIQAVRTEGDQALVRFTREWDEPNFEISQLKVTREQIDEAYKNTPKETIDRIKEQIELARKFHEIQRQQIRDWQIELEKGILVGEKWTPIDEVGLYVPGGKNPFPTVQQILAVAAKTAGCKRIVSCISPKGKNYEVLIAANECGLTEIYRVGGAQAIAAMAYGTESIKPISLIAGPGSPYVTAAKILCQQKVAIDMPAGPSEAIILADGTTGNDIDLRTKARYCAADVLARAEHGPDSAGVLVTDSMELAKLTKEEIERQYETLSRQKYIKEALSMYSGLIVTANMQEAIDFTNQYSPEHLEVLVDQPEQTLGQITNAGSVFLGYYNPVATGDYATGINHILPSAGWARQTSAVGVWTFMKRVQFSSLTQMGLHRLKPIVQTIATVEGLDAHRRSVEVRFE